MITPTPVPWCTRWRLARRWCCRRRRELSQAVVPIHFGGFELAPFYLPVADPLGRFERAGTADGVAVTPLAVGGVM